ncbi:MAG: MFS transporter [Dehalococcoidia bacterium]|nr:MFS transporter [Dehalococcoidia bacterium]
MASSTLQSAGIARYTIWAARLVVFAAFFDLFVQFPTIAPYAESLGASAALVGVIVAAYSFTNLFGNLGAGYVLDRWGRRTPMVLGMAITVIAVFSYSLVQTPEQMMAARAVHGIGAAVLAPGAFSIIGDRTAADRWGHAMGITGALIAVAALIGPPAAGILRDIWGANVVFYVDSAFIVITLIAFLLIARDGSPSVSDGESDPRDATGDEARRNPALWSAYAAAFAITVGIGALVTHLPLMLEEQGETAARSGYSFGIYALVAMLVMASPISRAGDRYGRFGPMMLGLVGIAIGLALLGVLEGYGGVVAGMAVFGLGYGLVFPAATALVASATGADRRGMAFGVFYAVYSFGVVVGASGSGRLASLSDDLIGLPFLVGAAVVLAAVPLVAIMRYAAAKAPSASA